MTRPAQAENLLRAGYLAEEAHTQDELVHHLELAKGHLQVATTAGFPLNIRYLAAYDSMYQIAEVALRKLDLRVRDRSGARAMAIQALAWTLNASKDVIPIFIQANNRRGDIVYSPAGAGISDKELGGLISATQEILKSAEKALKGR